MENAYLDSENFVTDKHLLLHSYFTITNFILRSIYNQLLQRNLKNIEWSVLAKKNDLYVVTTNKPAVTKWINTFKISILNWLNWI